MASDKVVLTVLKQGKPELGIWKQITLDTITYFLEDWTISDKAIPIPTKSSEESLIINTGVSENIIIHATRVNPIDFDDLNPNSQKWSNAKWITYLKGIVDRWQMETDGCIFEFIPMDRRTYRSIRANAYISSFKDEYSSSSADSVTVQMTVRIGGYKCDYEDSSSIPGKPITVRNPVSGDGTEENPYIFIVRRGDKLDWSFSFTVQKVFPFEYSVKNLNTGNERKYRFNNSRPIKNRLSSTSDFFVMGTYIDVGDFGNIAKCTIALDGRCTKPIYGERYKIGHESYNGGYITIKERM